jgi:hypothetical protein
MQEESDYDDTSNDEQEEYSVEIEPPTESRYKTSQHIKRTNGHIGADILMSVCEMTTTEFTPSQTALRRYPLQFWCEFAGAVMDDNTGKC